MIHYHCLETKPNSDNSARKGEQDPLLVGQTSPADQYAKLSDPVVPPPIEKQVPRDPQQQTEDTKAVNLQEPITVRVIEDDELSAFERKTARFGFWGLLIAGCSLFAASVAAYFVYRQLEELDLQNAIASTVAEDARIGSMESETTTAKQLHALQAQITAAQNGSKALQGQLNATIAGNRAWIVPDYPPKNKESIESANLEWHNAGKSPAVSVFSIHEFFIQYFPNEVRSCRQLKKTVKHPPYGSLQSQAFVGEGGRYEIGLDGAPPWPGAVPLNIHGCIWYTDVFSNTERYTEFFYVAYSGSSLIPKSEGVTLFYLQGKPFTYR